MVEDAATDLAGGFRMAINTRKLTLYVKEEVENEGKKLTKVDMTDRILTL